MFPRSLVAEAKFLPCAVNESQPIPIPSTRKSQRFRAIINCHLTNHPDHIKEPASPQRNCQIAKMGEVTEIVKSSDSVPGRAKELTNLAVDKAVEKAKKESGSTASAVKGFIAGITPLSKG